MQGIDIQSLFADIIQSPGQRRQSLTAQGMQQAQAATSGLTGGARLAAPLIAAMERHAPARGEMLERSIGGLLGSDTRNESEKLQSVLQGADMSTPEGQAAMLEGLSEIGLHRERLQLEQMLQAQAAAKAEKEIRDAERAEDRARAQSVQDLQTEVAVLGMESTRQQMAIRDANLTAEEEARALALAEQERRAGQQRALSTWFGANGDPSMQELVDAGVINGDNFRNFLGSNGKPVILSKDAILVNDSTGEVIATNPSNNVQAARDYSLTNAEVETYEAIINSNEDIKAAFKEPRFSDWNFMARTNKDKQRILIHEAEKIRASNLEMSLEQALRQAIESSRVSSSLTPEQINRINRIAAGDTDA